MNGDMVSTEVLKIKKGILLSFLPVLLVYGIADFVNPMKTKRLF